MFEKYNEKARRALFFARYEASKLGSKVIESEHLLLGILREGEDIIKEIFARFNVKPEEVRREIEGDRDLRRAHLLDRRAAALGGVEEDPRLRLARGGVDDAPLRRHGAPPHRPPARRRLRRRAAADGARLQPLRRARGDDLAHQGARGLEAEEGAPVPGRVQPRPDAARGGPATFDPADRPRQGSRADHPDPLAPHEEQPDPPRRAGRRQDRHRRGARDAHRRGRGSDVPRAEEDPRARPLAHRRRHEVPRPVRGAPEGNHPGAPREPGPHHLHRRDPLADRRGLGRGLARRREHPEAGALARRGLVHRRDDAQGVPQVHREGPQPPAPLPGDQRDGAVGERDASRSSRASRTGTSSSTRSATRPRRSRPPSTSRTATSPTASSRTRRSTSSTRPAPR